jgi:predicted permease
VASLSIARTALRARELAVRSSVGAGRARLTSQLLTESLVVALAGGVLGVAVAWLSLDLLEALVGRFTPRAQLALDGRVLFFALGVSLLTGLVCGAAPGLAARRDLAGAMRQGAAQAGGRPHRQRLRSALVTGQVAVSFVLLIGSALLLRSFHRLASVDLGYDTEQVMSAAIFGNFTALADGDALRIHAAVLDRLRAEPGVVSAAVTTAVPLSDIQPGASVLRIEGADEAGRPQADPNIASEGYFETLGISPLAGRGFRLADDAAAPTVAVINASMARLWEGGDPLGARFLIQGAQPPPGQDPWITVVGIVPDFQLYRADQETPPQFYLTFRQTGGFAGRVLARTEGDPRLLSSAIQGAVHAVDPRLPVEDVLTLAQLRDGRLAAPRLTTTLLATFAGLALLVTLAGVAGVVATSVSQRTRELGVRMALGATRGSVLRLVLGHGALLVGAGLGAGLCGALALSQLLVRFLFLTPPTDLLVYSTVTAVFAITGLAACMAPARRAVGTEPLVALRGE